MKGLDSTMKIVDLPLPRDGARMSYKDALLMLEVVEMGAALEQLGGMTRMRAIEVKLDAELKLGSVDKLAYCLFEELAGSLIGVEELNPELHGVLFDTVQIVCKGFDY